VRLGREHAVHLDDRVDEPRRLGVDAGHARTVVQPREQRVDRDSGAAAEIDDPRRRRQRKRLGEVAVALRPTMRATVTAVAATRR
jgi:hypothetical protein